MPETTPLIKAALNLRGGAGFDVYDTTLKIGYFNAPEIPDGYTVIAVNGYTNFPHVDLIFCNYDNNSNYVGVITISSRAVTEQATIEFICRKN